MSLLETAKKAVEEATKKGAYQAEVTAFQIREALTRFSKNVIHTNVVSDDYGVGVKVVVDKNKIGMTSVDSLEMASITGGVEKAIKMAKVSKPDPAFVTLTEARPVAPLKGLYFKETAEYEPEQVAADVKTLVETALDYNKNVKWSAGSFTITSTRYCVANSLGVGALTENTNAQYDVITRAQSTGGEGSGYGVIRSRNVKDLDPKNLALSAAKDAVESMNPKQIPLGEYEAIFRPEAVLTLVGFLSRLGYSGTVYEQGQSFLRGKLGTQLFDEKLTILDNGRDLATLSPSAFDGEGVPKKALMLVKNGVPENVCYDTYTALKSKTLSTGHAIPKIGRGFFFDMAIPMNQLISPGVATMDELIEDTKKGVIVTRLHYVNPTKPDAGIISGMTSDGMWFVENGEIKHPVLTMRFTDSVLRSFGSIDALGDKSTTRQMPGLTAPAVKTRQFRFTGHTEF